MTASEATHAAAKPGKPPLTGPAAKLDQLAKAMAMPLEAPPPPRAEIAMLIKIWLQEEGPWWLCSFVFHMVLVCSLALFGSGAVVAVVGDAPSFEAATVDAPAETPKVEHFEIPESAFEPSELNTETLTMEAPGQMAQEGVYYDDNPEFSEGGGLSRGLVTNQPNLGGLGGFEIRGFGSGPAIRGKGGGVGESLGNGRPGFGGRNQGSRQKLVGTGGGTRQSEWAVKIALEWLSRHQSTDGSWSLNGFNARCKDSTCSGPGNMGSLEIAGTALGLLPFLAAGQTHEERGPFRQIISAGVHYLMNHQKPDGSFTGGTTLYDHGLASITLCECYGMTGDQKVGKVAQAALDYIMEAQDPVGGGWRYQPKQPGDTSVTGWQVMALKSGQMAELNVNPAILERAKQFLESVSSGGLDGSSRGGRFGYTNKGQQTSALNAVGLLCYQYLGVPRTDPAMIDGTVYLMENLPVGGQPDVYYWYYATQVMHNQPGREWDDWNRKMRRRLIETQVKSGCAAGSWDAKDDTWGSRGGRVMQTSLSALTLEVYYRYLPLYKLDRESGPSVAAAAAEKPADDKP